MLCQVCQTIDISETGLSVSPLRSVESIPGALWDDFDIESKGSTQLGHVQDIITRASTCDFCYFVVSNAHLQAEKVDSACELFDNWVCQYDVRRDGSHYRQRITGLLIQMRPVTGSITLVGPCPPLPMSRDAAEQARTVLALQPYDSCESHDCPPNRVEGPESVARVVESAVSFSVLKEWPLRCDRDHMRCATSSIDGPATEVAGLQLVDVHHMKLVYADRQSKYVALSYVWGRSAATIDDISEKHNDLHNTAALEDVTLPATVRDAMTVVRELGERFLWVDALCIPQNEPIAKASQISQMDVIYRQAFFTIIAACGVDAEDGLAGVPPTMRQVIQSRMDLHDTTFVKIIDDPSYPGVQGSTWRQRAWTLQEDIFSRRRLVWTNDQVYWTCDEAQWSEEFAVEDLPLVAEVAVSLERYAQVRDQFLERRLTRSADTLNAFAGIMRVMSKEDNTDFIFGLPEREFTAALMWTMPSTPRNHSAATFLRHDGSTVYMPFPSWSWSAWRVPIKPYSTIFRPANPTDSIIPVATLYRQSGDGLWATINEDVASRPSSSPSLLEALWRLFPRQVEDRQLATVHRNWIDSGILQFWTSTSVAYITSAPQRDRLGVKQYTSVRHDAFLEITDFEYQRYDVAQLRQRPLCDHLFFIRGDARGYAPLSGEDEVIKKEVMVLGRVDADLKVMFFDRRDGIAYRAGAGSVKEKDWIAMERNWELMTLG